LKNPLLFFAYGKSDPITLNWIVFPRIPLAYFPPYIAKYKSGELSFYHTLLCFGDIKNNLYNNLALIHLLLSSVLFFASFTTPFYLLAD
jgi:hypothetical protein